MRDKYQDRLEWFEEWIESKEKQMNDKNENKDEENDDELSQLPARDNEEE